MYNNKNIYYYILNLNIQGKNKDYIKILIIFQNIYIKELKR